MDFYNITNKMNLLLEASIQGAKEIFTNPIAIISVLVIVVLLRFFYKSIRRIRYILYLAFVSGYGSILVDGLKSIAQQHGMTSDNLMSIIGQLFTK